MDIKLALSKDGAFLCYICTYTRHARTHIIVLSYGVAAFSCYQVQTGGALASHTLAKFALGSKCDFTLFLDVGLGLERVARCDTVRWSPRHRRCSGWEPQLGPQSRPSIGADGGQETEQSISLTLMRGCAVAPLLVVQRKRCTNMQQYG